MTKKPKLQPWHSIDAMAGQVEINVYQGGSSLDIWSWYSTMHMGVSYSIDSGEEKTRKMALHKAKQATLKFVNEILRGLKKIEG